MPGLQGLAGHGRLIYMIDTQKSVVYLIWVYTHAKFEGRPPEKSLRQLINEVLRDAESKP